MRKICDVSLYTAVLLLRVDIKHLIRKISSKISVQQTKYAAACTVVLLLKRQYDSWLEYSFVNIADPSFTEMEGEKHELTKMIQYIWK